MQLRSLNLKTEDLQGPNPKRTKNDKKIPRKLGEEGEQKPDSAQRRTKPRPRTPGNYIL